ncbi:MAG: YceI family protein [Caulobacter sp.]|nr:YceI family protein [Caulobacter sp.]
MTRSALLALPLMALTLAACQPQQKAETPQEPTAEAQAPPKPNIAKDLPAGTYSLDPDHTTVLFKVDHIGLSNFTAQFRKMEGTLLLDPAAPEKASLNVEIETGSLDTKTNPKLAFDKEMTSKAWLDAKSYPKITFVSSSVVMTGDDTALVTGDLTLHGVTHRQTLNVKFNGGYGPGAVDPNGSRIGFSATGSLNRLDFGISYGIPAEGSRLGVSDEVKIIIETEFTQPLPKPAGN